MNRVVLSKGGAVLSLVEVGDKVKITMSSERVVIDRVLDATEMGALKVFVNAYVLGLTPGGDTTTRGGD